MKDETRSGIFISAACFINCHFFVTFGGCMIDFWIKLLNFCLLPVNYYFNNLIIFIPFFVFVFLCVWFLMFRMFHRF